ncbi:MAG: ABC transporter substrate-binding protein [Pseudomonadota bacterium]
MAFLAFAGPPVHATAANSPEMVVGRFHEALLAAMKNADAWSYEQRRDSLAPIVAQSFDFAFMVRFASGVAWKAFDEAQQARVSAAFADFTLANYAARFHGYSGQRFETLDTVPQRGGRVLVRSQLVKADGEAVRLDYLMNPSGDGWAIMDIFLDGKFSELARRRAEFAPLLRDQGAEGLIAALEDRAQRLAAGDDSAG